MKKSTLITRTIVLSTICISLGVYAQASMYTKLRKYLSKAEQNISSVSNERKEVLKEIASIIVSYQKENKHLPIIFICTHNSRRSQMGQAMGKAASAYYGLKNLQFYSGGTAATAFNKRAIEALKKCGFNIIKSGGTLENPNYTLQTGRDDTPMIMFSKKYSDKPNPQTDFLALMVCSEADKSCPMVEGAAHRISLPYEDPKHYDDTPSEKQKYNERAYQIATEMLYLFGEVKKQLIIAKEKNQ